jgi:hypothetical protein
VGSGNGTSAGLAGCSRSRRPPSRSAFRHRLVAIRCNAPIFLLNGSMTGAVFFMTQYQQVSLG